MICIKNKVYTLKNNIQTDCRNEISMYTRIAFVYYRIFGVTFGGVIIDNNGVHYNKYLDYYGYIGLILHITVNILTCYIWSTSKMIQDLWQ